MRNDSGQFGSFDGADNRKELFILIERIGHSLPAALADECRAQFVREVVRDSCGGFGGKTVAVQPMGAVECYQMLVSIAANLDIDINWIAKRLEQAVAKQDKRPWSHWLSAFHEGAMRQPKLMVGVRR